MASDTGWLDPVATGGYHLRMVTVSIKEAKDRLSELIRLAEAGEMVVITRNGEPVGNLVGHKKPRGLNFEALRQYKREHGIDKFFTYVAPDFDDPLPEDFLITPEPPDAK
jgi:prevent-host-death family protein